MTDVTEADLVWLRREATLCNPSDVQEVDYCKRMARIVVALSSPPIAGMGEGEMRGMLAVELSRMDWDGKAVVEAALDPRNKTLYQSSLILASLSFGRAIARRCAVGRNETLEEAAKVAEGVTWNRALGGYEDTFYRGKHKAADAIRALKTKPQAMEGEKNG